MRPVSLGKCALQLGAGAFLHQQPGFFATLAQHAEVVKWQRCLAAKLRGGMFSHDQDAQAHVGQIHKDGSSTAATWRASSLGLYQRSE